MSAYSQPWRPLWFATALLVLFVGCLLASPAWAGPPVIELDCAVLDCAEVLPGAARFEAAEGGTPYQVGLDTKGEVVGWVALSTDLVDIKAYSGKPLVTLVGLSPAGVITGTRVLHHSEPILLVGIPERELHDFVAHYVGEAATAKFEVGASSDPDAIVLDIISGATVTVLAQNQTILDTVRALGVEVGVVNEAGSGAGHFVVEDTPWTWAQMIDAGVFGRLRVTQAEMGLAQASADDDQPFIDLLFTIADPPQIGRALMAPGDYDHVRAQLAPGEHLLVIIGNGSSSFKGSGYVRGGIFDRVRLEQGLGSVMFHDTDYTNLPKVMAQGAPRFREGAVYIVREGHLDPGAPFQLVFIGSRYDQKGAFSREFHTFETEHQLPASVYVLDELPPQALPLWRQAWQRSVGRVLALVLVLMFVAGLFVGRRWMTGKMRRTKALHVGVMIVSVLGLGLWLRAQPSVTQLLTLIGSVVHEWRWDLFLLEPILFVFWIFIAVVTLVWGRGVFCGWLCPYGSLTELLYKLARKLRIPTWELPESANRWVRLLRYGVLAGLIAAFLYSPELGERLAEIEPFKTTFFVRPWTREWLFVTWWVVLLAASVVMFRPFCRYLCPLGAGLALLSSARLSGPHRRNFCSRCTICSRGCEPGAIRVDGTIDPRECLSCMECEANYRDQSVCPPLIGISRLTVKIKDKQPSKSMIRKLGDLTEQAKDR